MLHETTNVFVRLPNGGEDAFDGARVWIDEVGVGRATKQRTYVCDEREDGTLVVSRALTRMRTGRVEAARSTVLAVYQPDAWLSVRREHWRHVRTYKQ